MPRPTSAPTRHRLPLSSLPLHHYVPAADIIPSPISLPLKRRNSPSRAESNISTSPQKQRRLNKAASSDLGRGGDERVKKRDSGRVVTPKVKDILNKDDLGTGRSPARRLFADASGHSGLGISGAVPVPRSPVASSSSLAGRRLAPSPPIIATHDISSSSTIQSPTTPTFPAHASEAPNLDIHDCGFVIYAEEASTLTGVGIGTPDSRKNRLQELPSTNPLLHLDALGHIPSSPTASSRSNGTVYDDKENVPPTPYASSSTDPSLSKYSSSAKSTPSHSRFDEEEVFFSPTSSRRRTIERSKLGIESVSRRRDKVEEPQDDDTDEEDDELTPGKTVVNPSKGKARMAKELDRI